MVQHQSLKNLAHTLSELGVNHIRTNSTRRHVRIANLLYLIMLSYALVFHVVYLIFGAHLVAFVVGLGATIAVTAMVLTHSGHHFVARHLAFAYAVLAIAFAHQYWGPSFHLDLFFFPLTMIPFLLFSMEERKSLFVGTGIALAGFFVSNQWSLELIQNLQPLGQNATARLVVGTLSQYSAIALVIVPILIIFQSIQQGEEELHSAAQERLKSEKDVSIGQMAGTLAHEINSPLTITLSAMEMINMMAARNKLDPAKLKTMTERAETAVTRISGITQMLRGLHYSSVQEAIVQNSFNNILRELLAVVLPQIHKHNIELRQDITSPQLELECRKYRLFQALLHLFEFAILQSKSDSGAIVNMNATQDQDHLVWNLEFSAGTIGEEEIAKINDAFYTTSADHKADFPGLAMASFIINRHHGSLKVERAGTALVFTVTLPIHQPRDVEAAG
ncbi:MAG: HAMP domain-containing histidine kinase [Bdellovibrionales bacterium]|nr:HAMP domain-containing histidine kinase [Bdellovibrionales bacterium]